MNGREQRIKARRPGVLAASHFRAEAVVKSHAHRSGGLRHREGNATEFRIDRDLILWHVSPTRAKIAEIASRDEIRCLLPWSGYDRVAIDDQQNAGIDAVIVVQMRAQKAASEWLGNIDRYAQRS